MYDVVALGELLIDFTTLSTDSEGYPTMAAHPGGAPANYLSALSKFGNRTALIGKVGKDSFGKLLLQTLEECGIATEGIISDDNVFTTLAFVTLSKEGEREFSFARKPGADTQLNEEEVQLNLIRSAKVFHFGTLSLTAEPSREATYRACEYARSLGKLISFDPNLRKPLWNNLWDAKREISWGLHHADVVKISDEELEFLWNLSPEEGAKKIVDECGAKLVFVTCGPKGVFFKNKVCQGFVDALHDLPVVDTTGAGDIFGGSAMHKILLCDKDPAKLSEKELREITQFACTSAGISTTRPGGLTSVPSFAEIVDTMRNLQNKTSDVRKTCNG